MRTLFYYINFVLLLSAVSGGTQTFDVTQQTLGSWSVTGADRSNIAAGGALVIPINAQLARTFAGNDIAVRLITKPVFGDSTDNWAVLEIGSTALIFTRNGSSGQLQLILGDNTPIALPFTISVNADGQGVDPVKLSMERKENLVTVSAFGQTLSFVTESSSPMHQDVVLSAGSGAAWPLDSLQITVPDDESTFSAGNALGQTQQARAQPTSKSANVGMTGLTVSIGSTGGDSSKSTEVSASTVENSTLQIFTPPAVRFGRANAVRSIVAQSKH